MNEPMIIEKIQQIIADIIESSGYLTIVETESKNSKSVSQNRIDIEMQVETKYRKRFSLLIEIKTEGQPRFARMAVSNLLDLTLNDKSLYGIFATTFVSEESKRICRDNGIGYIDLAGNCYMQFNGFFLNIEGRQNHYRKKRVLKSLFGPKSTRALRVLLCDPRRSWFVKDLAEEAKISLGQCSNVKRKLLDYEFILEKGEGRKKKFRLVKPRDLLESWSENYDYKVNTFYDYYSMLDVSTIETKVSDYLKSKNIMYAFSLTSGASLTAPFLRYKRVFLYLQDDPDKVAEELGFKRVTTGGNVTIMQPYDEGIFYGIQKIKDTWIVSDIQLYLDLKKFSERGEEAAEFLLENRIKKKW